MNERNDILTVLFLCTGNSCRSQMAEGWVNHLKQGRMQAFSAGILAKGVDPRAANVMAEAGVDISGQWSKTTDEVMDREYDYVITLCGHARENCPFFPGGTVRLHRGFDDPPLLAASAVDEEEALAHYRRVRDEIRRFVKGMPENLADKSERVDE